MPNVATSSWFSLSLLLLRPNSQACQPWYDSCCRVLVALLIYFAVDAHRTNQQSLHPRKEDSCRLFTGRRSDSSKDQRCKPQPGHSIAALPVSRCQHPVPRLFSGPYLQLRRQTIGQPKSQRRCQLGFKSSHGRCSSSSWQCHSITRRCPGTTCGGQGPDCEID